MIKPLVDEIGKVFQIKDLLPFADGKSNEIDPICLIFTFSSNRHRGNISHNSLFFKKMPRRNGGVPFGRLRRGRNGFWFGLG